MKVLDELERLQEDALKSEDLRIKLLETKAGDNPLFCFCRLARSLGYEINEMDLVYAGEEAYTNMRRATNGEDLTFQTFTKHNTVFVTDQEGIAFPGSYTFIAEPGVTEDIQFKRKFL